MDAFADRGGIDKRAFARSRDDAGYRRTIRTLHVSAGRAGNGALAGDDVAAFRAVCARSDAIHIIVRDGQVIDDLDVDRTIGGRSIAVRRDDSEALQHIVRAGRRMPKAVVGQQEAVGERARSRHTALLRGGGEARDGQRAERGRHDLPRHKAAVSHSRHAADGDARQPVRTGHAERTTLRQRGGVGRAAIGKMIFLHHKFSAISARPIGQASDRNAIVCSVDGDRQSRRRRAAVPVGDRVVEMISQRLARHQELHRGIIVGEDVAIPAARADRQRAVSAVERAQRGDGRPVRALHIGNAIGCVRVRTTMTGQQIAVRDLRAVLGHAVHIVDRAGRVVRDGNCQGCSRLIAIRIRDDDIEDFCRRGADHIVGQHIIITDNAVRNRCDGQRAVRGVYVLAQRRFDAVDRDDCRRIIGGEDDRAGGAVAAAACCRPGRLLSARR